MVKQNGIHTALSHWNGWTVRTGIQLPNQLNTGAQFAWNSNVSGIWMAGIQILILQ
jgi:hypothetical protein